MTDRRTRKSKEALKNALLDLLHKKSLQEIQVKQLCDKADVNRSTFYNNYQDVEEVLQEIYQDAIHMITSQVIDIYQTTTSNKEDIYDAIYQAVCYFQKNNNYFSLLFSQRTKIRFEELLYHHYLSGYHLENLSIQKKYHYLYQIIGGFSIIHAWMADGYPISAHEITEILMEKTRNNLDSFSDNISLK